MRLVSFFVVPAVMGLAIGASAAPRDREVYIFNGAPLAQSGISVGSWGSGRAVETAENQRVLTGSRSIKITTQGLYAGARIDFAQPVALFTEGLDPNRYVVFTFFFEQTQTMDPGAGTSYAYDIEPYSVPKAGLVRFVFESDSGASISAEQITRPLDPDDNWCRIAVPLAKFKQGDGPKEFRLKRLLIFTDLPTTLYLGEIKLVTDDSPIKVDPISSQTVVIYDEVLFSAVATSGVSALKYSWDFDASNGVQQESTGMIGRFVYIKGGEFTVTLTVSDADNIKQPVTTTAIVSVTD